MLYELQSLLECLGVLWLLLLSLVMYLLPALCLQVCGGCILVKAHTVMSV